jgi:hypothetical protein
MEAVGRKKYCCKYPGCDNWYLLVLLGDVIIMFSFFFYIEEFFILVYNVLLC